MGEYSAVRSLELPKDYVVGDLTCHYTCAPVAIAAAFGLETGVVDLRFRCLDRGFGVRRGAVSWVSASAIGRVVGSLATRIEFTDYRQLARREYANGEPRTFARWLKDRPLHVRQATCLVASQDHVVAVRGDRFVDTFGAFHESRCPHRRMRVTEVWRIW